MKATTLLLFLTLAIPPSLFFLVNSQSLISSSVSSTVTHIAVSANGVFVSTATQVYRFSSTLQQLGDPLGSIGGTVNGLACTIDGEWCVVCTDAGGVTCSVLDGSNLEAPANRTVTNSGTATSLVVFTAPGGDGNSFYTGSYVNARILYHQYGFAGSTQSRATNPVHQQTFSFNRVFVSGFFASGYAYYFVNDPPTSGVNRRLRIIRVCNDSAAADGFNNQYELTLGCDDKESFFNPTLLGVSVINEETLLIVIRTSSVDICSYSLSEINSLMDAAYQSCVVNGTGNKNIYWQSPVLCSAGSSQLSGSICSISDSRGSTPAPAVGVSSSFTPSPLFTNSTVLNELTAFLGLSIDGIDFNYFAFTLNNNNYTAKYHLVNGTSLAFVSEVTSISSVTSLSWSQGSEYVYGISGSNFVLDLSYECVYGTVTRTATVNNDNTVTCNNNPVLTIEGGRGTQNVSLSIRQVYNGRKYTIETNATANLTVILYDCPTLARGCSSCLAQRIGTGFSCSWCNSNAQCRDISNCSDASPVISTGNCPLPIISDFNPKAGPPRGGTTIIIDGTNLGTQRSDIESIMIGTRNCIIDKYEPGARIKCTVVPDTRDKIDRNVTITIRVTRSNDSVTASSTTQYQFITPIIQSVSPTYGPFSGGTKIRVQGTNFDIGNKEMTKVIMRESSSRIKRNTCPNINCTIMSITNTEIYCVSGNINASDCMRNVVVSVNGALFSNTSISYQYRPDPTFNSTSTMNIIPAGGIQLVFTGANLNSVQSPTITITDSRLAPSSIESCVINDTDTMLICIAPNVSNVTDSSYYGTRIVYMLMLDGAESPNYMNADLRLTLQPNPIFTGIDVNSRSISVNDGQINNIFIAGMNIRSVSLSEITIMLGDDSCSIRTSSDTEINCIPPNKPSGTTLALRVRVGRNLVFPPNGYTGPEWTLVYTSTGTRSTSIGAIVGGSIAANVFIAVFLVAIPLITIIFILKKKLKEKKERNIPTVTDEVIPMSTNLVYQSNISQDFTRRQLNSTQNSSSSIRLYDEIQHVAGNQHEQELESDNDDNDANQNNERFFNQVNQEDYEENGRYMYIDSLVMDEDNL
uniref:IPT/TIG domain-containing protein n=1 Tax=Amphimedon queenslandica TaxID=400682 RepID=A0A1X7TYR3_AMPQE